MALFRTLYYGDVNVGVGGRITIPQEIRDDLGLAEGDVLTLRVEESSKGTRQLVMWRAEREEPAQTGVAGDAAGAPGRDTGRPDGNDRHVGAGDHDAPVGRLILPDPPSESTRSAARGRRGATSTGARAFVRGR